MSDVVWAAVIGGLLGFVSTYVVAVVKVRQDLRAEYDKDLRARRIPIYGELWKLTELFPKYGRTRKVADADIEAFVVSLRDWYFDGGGMYLSDESRDAYFSLQEELKKHMEPGLTPTATIQSEVDYEAKYEAIRARCSKLRTALVRDVGTRKYPDIVAG